MIKNIKVLSRLEVEWWVVNKIQPYKEAWALISIYEKDELMTEPNINILHNLNCKQILSLKFHDINKKISNYTLFTKRMARSAISFVDKINRMDIDILVVHCAAGVSRSGALGLFACRYLKLNETLFFEENKNIHPNTFVLKVLNKESGINNDYIKFWENNDRANKKLDNLYRNIF